MLFCLRCSFVGEDKQMQEGVMIQAICSRTRATMMTPRPLQKA
jgi:hypothetical protein